MKKFQYYLIIFFGIFFIFSALAKLFSIEYFELTIKQIIPLPKIYIQFISRLIISLEITLGLLFLIKFNLKYFTIPASIIMLFIFNFILLYQEIFLIIENCGCMGELLPISPITSLIRNILFILLLLYLYFQIKTNNTHTYKLLIIFPITFSIVFAFYPIKYTTKIYYIKNVKTKNITDTLSQASISSIITDSNIVNQKKQKNFSLAQNKNLFIEYPKVISKYSDLNEYHPNFDVNNGLVILLFLSLDCNHCKELAKKISPYIDTKNSFTYFLGDKEDISLFIQETNISTNFIILEPSNFFNFVDDFPPKCVILFNGHIIKEFTQKNFTLNDFIKHKTKFSNN